MSSGFQAQGGGGNARVQETSLDAGRTWHFGSDDHGFDVKFWGATSGAYMLWDASADELVFAGGASMQLDGSITVDYGDDVVLGLGESDDAKLLWETADANANALILQLPSGGAVNVPVFAIGTADATAILNANLGWFNGVTQTTLAIVDADGDSYVKIDYSADDVPRIAVGGSAATIGIGNATTALTMAGTYTTGLLLSGTMANGINATGTFSDHVIDIQPAATLGDYKAIYIGTWDTEAQFNAGGGLFRIYGKAGTAGSASAMIFTRALCDTTTPTIGAQFYTDCSATTPGPNALSGIDVFCILNASAFLAASTSWLEGMHAAWFKIAGDATSTCNGRATVLWVDNQMSCTVSGEEYGIVATTGGTRPDGFIGFETSSSGYDQLLYFDETFNAGAGTCVTTDAVPAGNQDARIKVYYNGTQYYLPLYR